MLNYVSIKTMFNLFDALFKKEHTHDKMTKRESLKGKSLVAKKKAKKK